MFISSCPRLISVFSALAGNVSLTNLDVGGAVLGSLDVGSALARALLSNRTLRELKLTGDARAADDGAAEPLALILTALGGVGEAPDEAAGQSADDGGTHHRAGRCCAVLSLSLVDMPVFDAACATALGASLRRGAALSELRVTSLTIDKIGVLWEDMRARCPTEQLWLWRSAKRSLLWARLRCCGSSTWNAV